MVRKDAKEENDSDNYDKGEIFITGSEVIVDQTFLPEIYHESHRVYKHHPLDIGWQHLQRIDDRRRIKERHDHNFPDHRKIAQLYVPRRGEQRKRDDKHICQRDIQEEE